MAINLNLVDNLQTLEGWGLYDVMLPFLLVFILVFAILERIQIFGKESKKFNALIALVIGLLLVRGGEQAALVQLINAYLPNVSAVIVVFLGFLILLGLFGFGSSNMRGGIMILFVILAVGGGIWALTNASEQGDFEIPLIGETISEEDAGALIIIGVFVLIVAIAIMKPKPRGLTGFMKGMNDIGDSFAGVRNP